MTKCIKLTCTGVGFMSLVNILCFCHDKGNSMMLGQQWRSAMAKRFRTRHRSQPKWAVHRARQVPTCPARAPTLRPRTTMAGRPFSGPRRTATSPWCVTFTLCTVSHKMLVPYLSRQASVDLEKMDILAGSPPTSLLKKCSFIAFRLLS